MRHSLSILNNSNYEMLKLFIQLVVHSHHYLTIHQAGHLRTIRMTCDCALPNLAKFMGYLRHLAIDGVCEICCNPVPQFMLDLHKLTHLYENVYNVEG